MNTSIKSVHRKIVLLLFLLLISFLAESQLPYSSRFRVSNDTKFGWPQKMVPVKLYSDSTWISVLFKEDLPNFANGFWGLAGNALATNTLFIGSTNNRSLVFKTNNVQRGKFDTLGNFGINQSLPLSLLHIGSNIGLINRDVVFISNNFSPTAFGSQLSVRTATTYAAIGNNASIIYLDGNITSPASGVNALLTGLRVGAFVHTAGGSSVTEATSFYVTGQPSGATFNYAVHVNSGISRFDGNISANNGTTTPSAKIHLGAGTAAASTSPEKFTAGVLMITPESGAVETDATNTLYYTPVATRYKVGIVLTNTAVLDFPNTVSNGDSDLTMTVTGAVVGDAVSLGFTLPAQGVFVGNVTAANTVNIRFHNSAGAFNPASATYKATVIRN